MDLLFHGATGDTTGSCHLLRANGCEVLFDCGLYQGRRSETYARNAHFGFAAARIDAVVQSHAHVDHCGKLPMLVRGGFGGRIHATHGTRDLAEILLHDSANIQVKDAEHLNRERWRARSYAERRRDAARNCPPTYPAALARSTIPEAEVTPLYVDEDVDATLPLFDSHVYREWFDVARGVRARFHDAGHILGSAWIEAEITEGAKVTRLVFTGDYGRPGQPILRDPEPLAEADIFISESTYGARSHPPFVDMERQLGDAVERLARRGRGRLLVPVFAVGRAQNILYTLSHIFEQRAIGDVHVAVDSPLASRATEIVLKYPEYFDEEALSEFHRLQLRSRLKERLTFTESVDDSKALNRDPRPMVVLSASGMMESGRIVHHLAWHISSEDTEILVVGYQAANTLGRRLVEKAREVNILGHAFQVRAKVTTMNGFSAHADREGLLAALTPHAKRAKALFLVHGENDQRMPLARNLVERGFARVETPEDARRFEF
ncbi:MAG: MBL fold metallo-hydrolase [Planctomycetes bacterium]|nr:MBL fold metallo-hydrolase [Planctomycetota bacterium]